MPGRALSHFFEFPHKDPDAAIPFPNFQRLYIESTPLHPPPKLLLERLDKLLRERKELGLPLYFVGVKVNCKAPLPITEPSAFLTAWGCLIEEDVR